MSCVTTVRGCRRALKTLEISDSWAMLYGVGQVVHRECLNWYDEGVEREGLEQ
jgi:hypothetical protein